MSILLEQEIKERAALIADLVASTHTDQRHVLYMEVGRLLAAQSQNYSGSLFIAMGKHDRGDR